MTSRNDLMTYLGDLTTRRARRTCWRRSRWRRGSPTSSGSGRRTWAPGPQSGKLLTSKLSSAGQSHLFGERQENMGTWSTVRKIAHIKVERGGAVPPLRGAAGEHGHLVHSQENCSHQS